jgi:hypothetical protein
MFAGTASKKDLPVSEILSAKGPAIIRTNELAPNA